MLRFYDGICPDGDPSYVSHDALALFRDIADFFDGSGFRCIANVERDAIVLHYRPGNTVLSVEDRPGSRRHLQLRPVELGVRAEGA